MASKPCCRQRMEEDACHLSLKGISYNLPFPFMFYRSGLSYASTPAQRELGIVLFFFFFFGRTTRHIGSSSLTRDQTHALCIGKQILNWWTTREISEGWVILGHSSPPQLSRMFITFSSFLFSTRAVVSLPYLPIETACPTLGCWL